tara:strand:+ start:2376 stop:2684 length:309 start_codon:yes stop_codon:yes gene_type:complete
MSQKYAIVIPAVDVEGGNAIQVVCDKSDAKKIHRIIRRLPEAANTSYVGTSPIKSGAIQFDDCYEVMVSTDGLNRNEEDALISAICKELEKLLGHRKVSCVF